MPDIRKQERSNAVKSSFILLAMLISVFGISVGRAQETVDMSKITCAQFLTGQVSDSLSVSIWLNGYYNGTRHNTVVDVSALKQHQFDMLNYCTSHRDMNLMEAIETVFGAKK